MDRATDEHRLGIDIGGVIIQRIDGDSDTSFHKDFLSTPEVADAIEAIRDIVGSRFGDRVWLISKCGPEVEGLTRHWLDARRFFQRSGVPQDNTRFCRERAQKAAICEGLGITHFIDDRLEVLSYLKSVESRYLFQPRPDEVGRFAQHLHGVRVVHNWSEIRDDLAPRQLRDS